MNVSVVHLMPVSLEYLTVLLLRLGWTFFHMLSYSNYVLRYRIYNVYRVGSDHPVELSYIFTTIKHSIRYIVVFI